MKQGFVDFSLDDFSAFSDEKLVTVRKFFANRTTVRVPTCPMALNGCYGGFSVSDELAVNLYVRMHGEPAADRNSVVVHSIIYDKLGMRTDPILIDEILKIGLKASGGEFSRICLQQVPLDFENNITIHEYDGSETAGYNCQHSIRSLINDASMSSSDLLQRLIELDFLCLAFEVLGESKITPRTDGYE